MHENLFLAARTHDQSVRFVDYGQFENRLIRCVLVLLGRESFLSGWQLRSPHQQQQVKQVVNTDTTLFFAIQQCPQVLEQLVVG
jgi:hypothetical protein